MVKFCKTGEEKQFLLEYPMLEDSSLKKDHFDAKLSLYDLKIFKTKLWELNTLKKHQYLGI